MLEDEAVNSFQWCDGTAGLAERHGLTVQVEGAGRDDATYYSRHRGARRLIECDAMRPEARQPGADVAAAWQQCRKNPTDNCVWEELFRLLAPLFGSVVSRTLWCAGVRDTSHTSDLLQDLAFKIWKLGATGRPHTISDGKVNAYFRAMAANTARNWLRQRFGRTRDMRLETPIDDPPETLSDGIGRETVERKVLVREMEKHVEGSSRDRQIFGLYYRRGFTAAEIAAIPAFGLSVKGVEALIHRMTADLRKKMCPRNEVKPR